MTQEDNKDDVFPRVSKFDYSVDNHFKAMDKIGLIDGSESEFKNDDDETETHRLSSSVTFLRKWRDFCYQPGDIKFACESEETLQKKDITALINMPQFSSAAVPKDMLDGSGTSSPLSKDFVMYVGGHVWALDWCPRIHQSSDYDCNVEFIAVSAHPPESLYHKIGAPLTGRGLIQIWCLLNTGVNDQDVIPSVKLKRKKYSKNNEAAKHKENESKKPRGRPRKNPINEIDWIVQSPEATKLNKKLSKRPRGRPRKNLLSEIDGSDQLMQDRAVQSSENADKSLQIVVKVDSNKPKKPRGRPTKKDVKESVNKFDNSLETSPQPIAFELPDHSPELLDVVENDLFTPENVSKELDVELKKDLSEILPEDEISNKFHDHVTKKEYIVYKRRRKDYNKEETLKSMLASIKSKLTKCQIRKNSRAKVANLPLQQNPVLLEPAHKNGSIPEDVALPRLVMALAHNGKTAWDVKWRPVDSHVISKHRMGYLAVLLGSGALEVWEVPLPHTTKAIFSSCQTEGTDPRFVKLTPIFKCTKLKCGDRQSIPIALEWSASAPHDLILAGCHDGMVALWKFSANGPSKDTRPLICFGADTVPIRALKWAPLASDSESTNIIVTAGHNGLKFWDLRDPFRPLWDIPTRKNINSLDWLPDPSVVVYSLDDGEIRIVSLSKAACDVPVTGVPCVKTQQVGSHSYSCSLSSIWSVQVSITGMIAYCCSDGKVIRFQLTARALGKDPLRNREPHYLCGSITEEESSLTVFSPLPDVPFSLKRSLNEWGDTPRTKRGFLTNFYQEKRAKEQISKCQTSEKQPLGSEDTLVSAKKNKNFREIKTSKALVCVDDGVKGEEDNVESNITNEDEKETFPPKIIAMHRVRWNMNKGSERLLSYGGASGIVRCQQIS